MNPLHRSSWTASQFWKLPHIYHELFGKLSGGWRVVRLELCQEHTAYRYTWEKWDRFETYCDRCSAPHVIWHRPARYKDGDG